jgi:hypothetical protein
VAPSSAQAAVSGSVSVQPTSGPVGSAVTVQLSGKNCGQLVFEAAGNGPDTALDASGGAITLHALIPSFVGLYPSAPVRAGRYQFAASCTTGPNFGDFTNVVAPFTVTSAAIPPGRFVAMAPTPNGGGYWLAQAGGGVYSFGDAMFHGSLPGIGVVPGAPIVAMAATADGGGYWLVDAQGGIYAFGDAFFEGSLPGLHVIPAAPIVGISAVADFGGYWLVGADGGEFAFGNAEYCSTQRIIPAVSMAIHPPGYIVGRVPYVDSAANSTTTGFTEVDLTGLGYAFPSPTGICSPTPPFFSYGVFSPPVFPSATISGVVPSGAHGALWLVGIDGGVFTPTMTTAGVFRAGGIPGPTPTAPFLGSLPGVGVTPVAPILAIAATPDGEGYWLMGADGGVFAFGDARFFGSALH